MKYDWLRRNWEHIIILPILLFFGWTVYIVLKGDNNKASWLLVSITGIYAFVSVYIAMAGIRSAHAASRSAEAMEKSAQAAIRSAEAMEKSVAEMQYSRLLQYAPDITFRNGYQCEILADGSARIVLSILSDIPVMGLQLWLWRLEDTETGKNPMPSTMLESQVQHAVGKTNVTITLNPATNYTEKMQGDFKDLALNWFNANNSQYGALREDFLCVMSFRIKGMPNPLPSCYDLKLVKSEK